MNERADTLRKVAELRELSRAALDILIGWIEQFGDQRAPAALTLDNTVHDFIFFALTKGARTLDAASSLLSLNRPEDALVLARSAYECYLHASFIAAHRERIDDFVQAKVGAYVGEYLHPRTKRGRPIWQRVVHPPTGESLSHGAAIAELAACGRHPEDLAVHDKFYAFLSEYDHVHMIAIGAYCTPEYDHFRFEPHGAMSFPGALYTAYVTWLLTSEAVTGDEHSGIAQEVADVLLALSEALSSAFAAPADPPLDGLPDSMRARLGC